MDWVLCQLAKKSKRLNRIRLVTDIRSENVLSGSLDLEALELLIDSAPSAQVINLPRLHAKVYIADATFALVTSANLTRPGLEFNYEYGVGIDDPCEVSVVRADMESYSRLGNPISREVVSTLKLAANEVREEFNRLKSEAVRKLRIKVGKALDVAENHFLQAHVGNRTAHSLFADAIRYCLSKRPATTRELHEQIKSLLPDLCDDARDLVINGQHFGKKWKHIVRTAQVFLRRKGEIKLIGKEWHSNV
jgi:phosphatidylserine/phosphatidylglycerophosphate/cardiolipin synthase-like enzyme